MTLRKLQAYAGRITKYLEKARKAANDARDYAGSAQTELEDLLVDVESDGD